MSYEKLNRQLAILTAAFAFIGVLLGAIALGTNYWTIELNSKSTFNRLDTGYVWNGLFEKCRTGEQCIGQFWPTTFIICILGVSSLLCGGVLSAFDIPKASDRRFITPLVLFVACVLLTAGLVEYASLQLLNSHSSRLMIAATVFAYTALPISAFVAGRYSTFERQPLIENGVDLNTQKYSAATANGH